MWRYSTSFLNWIITAVDRTMIFIPLNKSRVTRKTQQNPQLWEWTFPDGNNSPSFQRMWTKQAELRRRNRSCKYILNKTNMKKNLLSETRENRWFVVQVIIICKTVVKKNKKYMKYSEMNRYWVKAHMKAPFFKTCVCWIQLKINETSQLWINNNRLHKTADNCLVFLQGIKKIYISRTAAITWLSTLIKCFFQVWMSSRHAKQV